MGKKKGKTDRQTDILCKARANCCLLANLILVPSQRYCCSGEYVRKSRQGRVWVFTAFVLMKEEKKEKKKVKFILFGKGKTLR